jgi:glutamate 5-kinase
MPDAQTHTSSAAAQLLAQGRRVTIKIGSSLLIGADGAARAGWLTSLAKDLDDLRRAGSKLVVVSSGAVALGRRYLKLRPSPRLDQKQAAAAAGQSLLMQSWQQALQPFGIPVAQLLLTLDDSEQRRRWINARATLEVLLAQDVVPIINENDSVATEELRYGDNDRLSARTAQMIRSNLLILLSDVDGLYSAAPATAGARHIDEVDRIDDTVMAFAGGSGSAGVGTGGMRTKLMAAAIAQSSGCATIIADGRQEHPIGRLLDGARATVFRAHDTPASAYKQWIKGSLAPAGSLFVDEGACKALRGGKSLLPAGVQAVDGAFRRGACVAVRGADGSELARGIAGYSAQDIAAIAGCSTTAIEEKLGYRGPDEIIHRNDLVLL